MTKSSWAALAAFGFTLACGVGFPDRSEAQASFDCRKATHPSEVAVCRDAGLASADRTLDAAFWAALDRSENPEALRSGQRRWLRDLRLCGNDPYCLAEAYAERIEELETGTAEFASVADAEDEPVVDPSGSEITSSVTEAPASVEERSLQRDIQADVPPARPVSSAAAEPEERQPSVKPSGTAGLIGGGLVLGMIVTVLIALLAPKALADHSIRKFGWPMILNWWNVLHLVAGFALWCGAASGSPIGGAVVGGGVWLIVLAVNIRKTDVLTGLAMTLVQPFVVASLFVIFQLARNKPKPYNYINRA